MKTSLTSRYWRMGLALLFFVAIALFWAIAYPHALSYQEQYQLFLWTSDYLLDALLIPGGFAAWLGEMVVQFYVIPWLGAALLALVFVALHCAVSSAMSRDDDKAWHLLSLLPPIMVVALMGDESVLLSYLVALTAIIYLFVVFRRKSLWLDVIVVPLAYWLMGPMAWLYVILRLLENGWRWLSMALLLVVVQVLAYKFCLPQWPLYGVMTGQVYYRIPMMTPTLMWVIPLVVAALLLLSRLHHAQWMVVVEVAVLLAAAWLSIGQCYDKDKYELMRQDYLVRNERWDEIIQRAQEYQVHSPFSSVCVNLALSQKRQLADRMFDFYQSGSDALVMPRIRDLTSMLPTAEVFWKLGMVNSAQRYMFDTQESILNAKKSGRCTKRIVECMIVNGHYKPAKKHIDLLKKTLFYRQWAKEAESCLGNEAKVDTHPVWGKVRRFRYKDNFLYDYPEIDKMFGLLFVNEPDNKMALDYMLGQLLLNGNVPGFQQHLPWAQQYGGYVEMPKGYQDVVRCIQSNGQVQGSPYMNYINAMKRQ